MAQIISDWNPIVEAYSRFKQGDKVKTPQGEGVVRAVRGDGGSAQVYIDGRLFDIPMRDIQAKQESKEGGQVFEEGDRVKYKTSGREGEVFEVTQRSVKVKWSNGNKQVFQKKQADKYIEKDESKPRAKVGDKVRLIARNGGSPQVGDIGVISGVDNPDYDGNQVVDVDFDSQKGWRGDMGEHLELVKDEEKEKEKKEEKEQTPKKTEDTVKSTGDGLENLMQLKEYMEKKIDSSVDGELAELRDLIKSKQVLEVKVGDKVNQVDGLKHKQLEQLITYAGLRLSPLLVGMAGTGKTHAGEQTAKALGLDFYSMSVGAQTSKSDIIGYTDANGNYVETHFRRAYEKGGVFLMDEIDAGNANVLIQVNAALSNGLCAFPDKMVERHPDFIFIASANTYGNGASRQYVGRNQLDAATLDRFAIIDWLIDDELESNLTEGIMGQAWYKTVRAVRDYVAEHHIRALVTPRATQKGCKLLNAGESFESTVTATILGSVPEDKKSDIIEVARKVFEKGASEVKSEFTVEMGF